MGKKTKLKIGDKVYIKDFGKSIASGAFVWKWILKNQIEPKFLKHDTLFKKDKIEARKAKIIFIAPHLFDPSVLLYFLRGKDFEVLVGKEAINLEKE